MRRILLIAAVVVLGSLAVVAVAIAAGGAAPVIGGAPAPVQQAATLTYTPATDATGTDPTQPARVSVVDGTLDTVTLTGPKGPVAGTLTADKKSWASTDKLAYGVTYTWGGSAKAVDGTAVPLAGTFATRPPSKKIRGTINIGDGRTVGRRRADPHPVQRARRRPRRRRAGAFGARPRCPSRGRGAGCPTKAAARGSTGGRSVYWPAHTKVTVTAKLGGVPYGGDTVGAADFSSTFTIGDAQVVKADVNSFRMVVLRNGEKVLDVPASYGLGSDPERNTRSGVHVVSEKFTDKRMVSQRYGYDTRREVGRADQQQRRVHPRQPGVDGGAGLGERHARLREPLDATTPRRTTTSRSTATPSRSPARRCRSPPATATSGTGRCRGTSGRSSPR